jgi:ABC-2 type transport system permease protein
MRLEFRLVWRSWMVRFAVAAATVLTTLALLSGVASVRQVDASMRSALEAERLALAAVRASAERAPLDAGSFGYATPFAVAHPSAPGAWFNLGETLAQPAVQRLRLLGLQGQVHDGIGGNPAARAAGAFDAAFVVAVLLPLLAVALLAPLAAEEREARRDGLLLTLVASPRRFWLRRVAARGVFVLAPVLLPVAAALFLMDASAGFALGVLGGVLLYGIGWIGLCAGMALRLGGGSDAIGAKLIALWALAVLVMPAFGGLALDRLAPPVPGSTIALAHRDAVNGAWDVPKQATFDAFFAYHPEWRDTPPVTGRFHWKWYFAFHHVADQRVAPLLAEAARAKQVRQSARDALGLVLPTVALQNLLDGLSDQGIEGEKARHAAAQAFHDRLRVAFYPFVFEERPIRASDLDALPQPAHSERGLRHRPAAWGGLALFALLGLGALWRGARGNGGRRGRTARPR